jgi:tRNA-dihydrouridine synthase
MDHCFAPIGEHMVLAMRRLHNDRIKATRIFTERIEKRSIVQTHRPTADRHREVFEVDDR